MKYRWRFLIYLILLIITLLVAYLIFYPKTAPEGKQNYIGLFECFTPQINMPYYPYVYTSGSLIDCLSFYESSHNPNAVGQAGEIGCLQFMPSTFQSYCVEKYGLTDIWNCDEQMECADRMILEGGINHWTTKNLCHSVSNVQEQ